MSVLQVVIYLDIIFILCIILLSKETNRLSVPEVKIKPSAQSSYIPKPKPIPIDYRKIDVRNLDDSMKRMKIIDEVDEIILQQYILWILSDVIPKNLTNPADLEAMRQVYKLYKSEVDGGKCDEEEWKRFYELKCKMDGELVKNLGKDRYMALHGMSFFLEFKSKYGERSICRNLKDAAHHLVYNETGVLTILAYKNTNGDLAKATAYEFFDNKLRDIDKQSKVLQPQ